MGFLLNAFFGVFLDSLLDLQNMSIVDIWMVYLLHVLYDDFLYLLHDGQHMDIADICTLFLSNVSLGFYICLLNGSVEALLTLLRMFLLNVFPLEFLSIRFCFARLRLWCGNFVKFIFLVQNHFQWFGLFFSFFSTSVVLTSLVLNESKSVLITMGAKGR